MLAAALVLAAAGCSKRATSAPAAPSPPTLTRISPDSGVHNATVAVTLTGTNFSLSDTQIESTAGLFVTDHVVQSTTTITAHILVSPAAALGDGKVAVMTAAGTSGFQTFTVFQPPPTLTLVTPNFGGQGSTVAVQLYGTNFGGGTTVDVGGGGVSVGSILASGDTLLSTSFSIDSGAALGAHGVTVSTIGGTSASVPFTVNTPPKGTRATPGSRRPPKR